MYHSPKTRLINSGLLWYEVLHRFSAHLVNMALAKGLCLVSHESSEQKYHSNPARVLLLGVLYYLKYKDTVFEQLPESIRQKIKYVNPPTPQVRCHHSSIFQRSVPKCNNVRIRLPPTQRHQNNPRQWKCCAGCISPRTEYPGYASHLESRTYG